jgi:hypothetical protein
LDRGQTPTVSTPADTAQTSDGRQLSYGSVRNVKSPAPDAAPTVTPAAAAMQAPPAITPTTTPRRICQIIEVTAVTPAGSGAPGAACAVPDTAAKIKPATAIASTVRSICLSLFYDSRRPRLNWWQRLLTGLSTCIYPFVPTEDRGHQASYYRVNHFRELVSNVDESLLCALCFRSDRSAGLRLQE